jgi:hypothetical protein
MIAEMRTYTVKPGKVQAYVRAYAELGRATQVKYLGQPLGYYTAEIGGLNKIVHLWGYASLAEREAKRAQLEADPAWMAYLKHRTEAGLLLAQENTILKAVDFPAMLQTLNNTAAAEAQPA